MKPIFANTVATAADNPAELDAAFRLGDVLKSLLQQRGDDGKHTVVDLPKQASSGLSSESDSGQFGRGKYHKEINIKEVLQFQPICSIGVRGIPKTRWTL